MKKLLLPTLVFTLATSIALYNIGNFPKMIGDEGIYVAQAYWLTHLGRLGPYTYWYDHFPLGWTQIGAWQLLVGPLRFQSSSVISARVFLGLILAGSTTLLYLLTNKLTNSKIFGILTSLTFITSALTLTFGRMVLLDNLAIFWFLASLLLLISHPRKLKHLALSALTLTISILTKESLLFFLPPYMYMVSYLNKDNLHRRYALTINYLTIFFFLAFFPLLAILKNEFSPHANQVSFLETILFQASRGSQLPFWQAGSHFYQMLLVWLRIDPILISLGTVSTLLLCISKIPTIQKIIASFTLFFFCFLARGGQIYDFYLIPIIPFLAINTSLLLHHLIRKSQLQFIPYIFVATITIYFVSSSLYPFTSNATNSQLTATRELTKLPDESTIIAPDYVYLDVYLQNSSQNIHWYRKVESDAAIKTKITNNAYILTDEQFERESSGGELPYLTIILDKTAKVESFGPPISPGETRKPYTHEYLTLYKSSNQKKQITQIISLPNIDQESLRSLQTSNPYAIFIARKNFSSSLDLQNKISLIKEILPNTLIFTSQDGEGNNIIPWITTLNRSLYKSGAEATDATLKKSLALKQQGFDGAIVSTSNDIDTYLDEIITASDSIFKTLVLYNHAIPPTPTDLVIENESDFEKIQQTNYSGKIMRLITYPRM